MSEVFHRKNVSSESLSESQSVTAAPAEEPPQVTVKAVFTGCLVGCIGSFLALYYSLKLGIVPSLNILSGLIGFIFVRAALAVGNLFGYEGTFTAQENTVIQTIAVAVLGTSCPGFGFATSYLAAQKQTCETLQYPQDSCDDVINATFGKSVLWCFALAFFGLFIAFPMRNHHVIEQRLLFPSGTATGFVIRAMHSCAKQARVYFGILSKFFSIAFLINTLTWAFGGMDQFPIFGMGAQHYGWSLDFDIGTIALSLLLDNRTLLSIAAGGVLAHGIIQPTLDAMVDGPLNSGFWYDSTKSKSPYLNAGAYTLFAGVAMLLVQALFSVAEVVAIILKSSRHTRRLFNRHLKCLDGDADDTTEPLCGFDAKEVARLDSIFKETKTPIWLSPGGYLVFGTICILVLQFAFHVEWYQVLVAMLVIPIFALTNIQGIARTDWDVSSVFGKLVMFPFGAWNRGGSLIPSLVLSTVTVSGTSNAGTLSQDFKTGWIVGASPGKMFIAQVIGQIFGCFCTPALFLLLRSAYTIPSSDPDAFVPGVYGPLYRILALIATKGGLTSLPKNVIWFALAFGVFAAILSVLQFTVAKKYRMYIPDPMAMAIGLVVPASPSLSFFIGFCVKLFWSHYRPEQAREQIPYIVSGALAGSGISVVCQCLVSLANLNNLVSVTFTNNAALRWTAASAVAGAILLTVSILVFCCGAWYWFSPPTSPISDRDVDEVESFHRQRTPQTIELRTLHSLRGIVLDKMHSL